MTSLVRFSPTGDMRRLQREIDTLFESFFPTRAPEGNGETATWAPRVDLAETEDAYLIYLDLPGMKKEDLTINYQDGTLSVSGERTFTERDEQEQPNFVRIERFAGHFYRSFTLPKAINSDKIKATYQDGVLTVNVPKAEESKPRRISIN